MQFDVMQLTLILSVFIPIIVGALYKQTLSPSWKKAINLVVALVTTVISAMIEAKGILTWGLIATWLQTTALSIAMYHGLYKDTALGNLLPGIGFGSNVIETTGREVKRPTGAHYL